MSENNDPLLDPEVLVIRQRCGEVRDHLATFVQRSAERGPEYRARFYQALLVELDSKTRLIQDARLDAVRELRDGGCSYDDIAQMLGLTRSRAQQLVGQAMKPRE